MIIENKSDLRKLNAHTLIEEISNLIKEDYEGIDFYKDFDEESLLYKIEGIIAKHASEIRYARQEQEIEEEEKNSVKNAISFLKDRGYKIKKTGD